MRVRVLFFGVLQERMGAAERTLELAEGASAGQLLAKCQGAGEDWNGWASIAVAVNQEYAGRERVLVDGDEVALLPPVSGGTGREYG